MPETLKSSKKRKLDYEPEPETILFTIGRMNPPTPGHMALIENMMMYALNHNISRICIVLSATVDDIKNPLFCPEKTGYLYGKTIDESGQIKGILGEIKNTLKTKKEYSSTDFKNRIDTLDVEVVCSNETSNNGSNSIPNTIWYLLGLYGYKPDNNIKINLVLMIGEDRSVDFQGLINDYFGKLNNITTQIIPIARPEGAISATQVRNYALTNDTDNYNRIMKPTGLPESDLHEIYESIREGITRKGGIRKKNSKNNKNSKKSKKSKNKKSKTCKKMKLKFKIRISKHK